jgi:NodT family efflux transporter outer membrane factor (OMF) lipoprotein
MNPRALCWPLFCLTWIVLVSCTSLRPAPVHRELAAGDVPSAFGGDLPTVAPPVRWWEELGSEELNRLMQEAFEGNLDLARAWARLRQFEAQAIQAAAAGRLRASASGDAGRSRVRRETGRDSASSFSLGLVTSYEVDLWGRIAAGVRAADLAAEASEQDVQATALALAGTLAQTWLQYRAVQARIAVTEGQLETGRKQIELVQARQRTGQSDRVDVLQQRQQIAAIESTLPPLRESLSSLALRLASLLGRPPHAPLALTPGGLPALPPARALGLPAHLIEHRPDIRGAWLRLRAQEWVVVGAEAERLPALSLTASASTSAEAWTKLFDNWVTNLAAGLTAPLVDGGRRRAAVAQAQALADERFVAYRDTVFGALHEVADTLASEQWKREHLDRLEREFELATETLDGTQRRYRGGLSDYLAVLIVQATQQRTELALVSARADLLSNRIDLYRVLGGQLLSSRAGPASGDRP